jgi:hypothetical protein
MLERGPNASSAMAQPQAMTTAGVRHAEASGEDMGGEALLICKALRRSGARHYGRVPAPAYHESFQAEPCVSRMGMVVCHAADREKALVPAATAAYMWGAPALGAGFFGSYICSK